MISRRSLLASAPAFLQAQTGRQRNVLLMIADDLGLHTGAYGDKTARTPNLDRMADEGVRFNHAYCTTASCSPSRSVMLTGLHTHSNGQYGLGHASHNFGMMPNIVPYPRRLKEHFYSTGVIGKLHVNVPRGYGWDYERGGGRSVYEMAQQAKSFIQNCGSNSWYLHMGYTDPHRDAGGFANRAYPGVKANGFDPAKIAVPSFLPDNPAVRADLAEYYESTNRLDQGVGFMFDVLRETGQLDNTLVIFLSDNGMPFPNAKTNLYDAGTRMPFIVRAPGQRRRGLVNNAMVSFADLAPTVLDWTGARSLPAQGRSWLSVFEEENPRGWDEVYFSHTFHEVTMYYPMRAVRTRRYKYIRNVAHELEYPPAADLWGSRTWQSILRAGDKAMIGRRSLRDYLRRPAEELYDVANDPDEVRNLAADASHRAGLEEMRSKLFEFRKRTNDPWTLPDYYRGAPPASPAQENMEKIRRGS
jgi:N-sulfoglucosamine sulfohydrolase